MVEVVVVVVVVLELVVVDVVVVVLNKMRKIAIYRKKYFNRLQAVE